MESSNSRTLTNLISFRSFVIGLGFAVIVYLVITILSGWEELIKNIFRINPLILILAMFLSFVNYIFRFLKWELFTRSLQLKIPLKMNFQIFIAGLSLAITPGKVGEAIRAFLLKETSEVGLSKGLASTFSERLIDLLAVVLLALFGVLVLGSNNSMDYFLILVIILIGIVFGVLIFLFDPLYNFFRRIFFLKPFVKIGSKVDNFRSDVVVTFRFSIFLGALILGTIGWACEGLGFYIIAHNLGITISLEAAIFIYTISSLLGAISFLPGGLGVVEGSMEIFLATILAINIALAGALIILIRLTTLWFGVALGTIFLLWLTKTVKSADTSKTE